VIDAQVFSDLNKPVIIYF